MCKKNSLYFDFTKIVWSLRTFCIPTTAAGAQSNVINIVGVVVFTTFHTLFEILFKQHSGLLFWSVGILSNVCD